MVTPTPGAASGWSTRGCDHCLLSSTPSNSEGPPARDPAGSSGPVRVSSQLGFLSGPEEEGPRRSPSPPGSLHQGPLLGPASLCEQEASRPACENRLLLAGAHGP